MLKTREGGVLKTREGDVLKTREGGVLKTRRGEDEGRREKQERVDATVWTCGQRYRAGKG